MITMTLGTCCIQTLQYVLYNLHTHSFDAGAAIFYRYITKKNLRYMFGQGFPDEEIDLIMKEAASNGGRGISYEDFLAQWNDDKDEFMEQWSRHMIRGVSSKGNALIGDEGPSDLVSELSFDESVDEVSRVNFQQSKAMSVRKLQAVAVQ